MPAELNIGNICGGAVPEVFERELREILANISDPNTPANAKRSIVFEFKFEPSSSREVAEVTFLCKSKLAPVTSVTGNIFLSRRTGKVRAFANDPRQEALFAEEKPESPQSM